jgi:hypothetical protein
MSVRLKRGERKHLKFEVSKKDLDKLEEYIESVVCLGA